MLAFGEAKMLAGWEDEVFAIDWRQQFKDDQYSIGNEKHVFPQVLNEFIIINWPIVQEIVDGFNVLQVDALHNVDTGMQVWKAQAPLPELHDIQAPAISTNVDDSHHEPNASPISAEEMLGTNPQDESDDIAGWIAEWCSDGARFVCLKMVGKLKMNMMALLIGHSHLETWAQTLVLMQVAFNHTCMLNACKLACSMSVGHVCVTWGFTHV